MAVSPEQKQLIYDALHDDAVDLWASHEQNEALGFEDDAADDKARAEAVDAYLAEEFEGFS